MYKRTKTIVTVTVSVTHVISSRSFIIVGILLGITVGALLGIIVGILLGTILGVPVGMLGRHQKAWTENF